MRCVYEKIYRDFYKTHPSIRMKQKIFQFQSRDHAFIIYIGVLSWDFKKQRTYLAKIF